MKISFDVKPETPKRVITIAGGLALIVGVVAVARAVPITFNNGDVLTADQLNMNFSNLEGRVAALEGGPHVRVQAGTHVGTYSDGTWTLNTGTGERTAPYPILFSTPFPPGTTPVVTAGVRYVDGASSPMILAANIEAVTNTGFTIRYVTYSTATVVAAGVAWHAFTP